MNSNFKSGFLIEKDNVTYYILSLNIHGGSGMGANYPYDGIYYLVEKDFFEARKDEYCMAHDSILSKVLQTYDKHGLALCHQDEVSPHWSEKIQDISNILDNLDSEILELLGYSIK
ncbi:MAG: hypothetical protein ACI3VR_01780 [Intestinibacter sp.]|uniref:hypothetical protein n=1 Tax=Intestinibacter sp. TaxID=1965304 RepID=UPI003F14940C